MVSDAAHAERLLSRRRIGRSETALLVLAALALSVGAAAWIADGDGLSSFVSAALPQGSDDSSFDERFLPPSPGQQAHDSDRSAVSAFRIKLRDAKALLAQKLVYEDWRTTLVGDDNAAAEDDRPVDGAAPTQRAEIPLPRSRPAQADLAAQIASSQAYAYNAPKADNRTLFQKFTDIFPGKIRLASLTPDSGLFSQGPDLAALGFDPQTAVYDISARALYLPSGVALEAHSGMGSLKDDPDHVHEPNIGATPPATYDLKPRERLFHGVRALRLTPAEGSSALGRVGLLTHSYLLGPGGDSNGCVSIKNYDRFIKAYDNGEFNR